MVTLGVLVRSRIFHFIGRDAADVELNHAVPLEVEQPDAQAQFETGREAGKWSPHATAGRWGRGLEATCIHVVKEDRS